MVFFNFLNFFTIFLEFSITGRVRTKRIDNFYFLSLSLFQQILARNEALMVFFSFFKFFCNFLLRIVLERNRTIIFIFSHSQPFPTYFGWKWCHNGIFLIFFNFIGIFSNLSGRNWTEWQFLFSIVLFLFQPILASKETIMVYFDFF